MPADTTIIAILRQKVLEEFLLAALQQAAGLSEGDTAMEGEAERQEGAEVGGEIGPRVGPGNVRNEEEHGPKAKNVHRSSQPKFM